MSIAAPPGTPYHHLARTVVHRWWRPVAGTLFILFGAVLLTLGGLTVVAVAGYAAGRPEVDGVPSFGALADLAFTFLTIAVVLPVILLAARWIQRRPAGSLASVLGRVRWRWLLTCLPVAAVAIVVFLGAGLALGAATGEDVGLDDALAGWGPFLLSTLVLLLVVPPQAAAEEFFTRGWLLQGVGTWFRRPWVPIAVQALVFASLHGWGTPWGFADLVLFGVVAGWLTVRTGGLEAAIALHVLNNLVSSVLAAAYGQLTVEQTAADMPWQLAVVDVPVLAAYAVVISRLASRHGVATRSPEPPVGAPAAFPGPYPAFPAQYPAYPAQYPAYPAQYPQYPGHPAQNPQYPGHPTQHQGYPAQHPAHPGLAAQYPGQYPAPPAPSPAGPAQHPAHPAPIPAQRPAPPSAPVDAD